MFEELARTRNRELHELAGRHRLARRLRGGRFWLWLADYAVRRADRARS